ncbi:MAG: DUF5674 family protein [Candidatus Woesebacteria bacterium]|nr:DUF5674 family protein [Candidatus Woesebacteria bacterium]
MITLSTKATSEEIKLISEHFHGYIKVVVDIEKKILCAGADRHVDEEQELLKSGSKQSNLCGGGMDIETGEIDYNSMINLRPNQNNPSRDILSIDIRKKFDDIVIKILRSNLKVIK